MVKDASERTRSVHKADASIRAFANADAVVMKDVLSGNGKYNPASVIMDARTIFKKAKWLEKLSEFNKEKLEAEDWAFLRRYYAESLSSFLADKGFTVEDLQSTKDGTKMLALARAYAVQEAQKATYRDASAVAQALNNLKKVPGLGILVEGLLPFTKTPINILKRGLEYSPLGLIKSLYDGATKIRNGEISVAEWCDSLAAGLTGTGITVLGIFLANLGMLRGGDDDDDKQEAFDTLQGYQNYSLNIGGINYTIDWTAPSALPLFLGEAIYRELIEKDGLTLGDVMNLSTIIAEPITTLSMLSGLNDALSSAKYDDNPLTSLLTTMASDYVGQAFPTLLSQISKTAVADRRTTYVDKNSDVPAALQRWYQTTVLGKTPLNYTRANYIDAWGRKDTTANIALRFVDNLVSPGYANAIQTTPVDRELQRLSNADGVGTGVLMTTASKSISVNGETRNLTADQYETYAVTRGQTALRTLSTLIASEGYAELNDVEKANAVENIIAYADYVSKNAVYPDELSLTWVDKCDGDTDNVINAALLKGQAKASDISASGTDDYFSIILNSKWMTTAEQGNAIAQQYSNKSSITDPNRRGYEYVLSAAQSEALSEYYRSIFGEYYMQLTQSQQWALADTKTKLEMLSDLRSDVSELARNWMADSLRQAGVSSTAK